MKLKSEPLRLENNVAVWSEMNELKIKYNGLSMGEGAPGYDTPEFLK